MERINQVGQPIRAENDNYQVTERNEFRMSHGEGTSVREIELEGAKTVSRQLSQFINIHLLKLWAKRHCPSTGFQICRILKFVPALTEICARKTRKRIDTLRMAGVTRRLKKFYSPEIL